jgi:hypothetical protein
MITFKKAVRTTAKIKMALTGPSGSGKTYSALAIAKGLAEKIAVLDTEVGSASLYSDIFEFDTVTIKPPFEAQKFIEVIHAAEKAGYELLIIDSLSHAWGGEGGALEQKDGLDARGGRQNQYTNWGPIKKLHNQLKEAILQSSMHIICTLRAKQEYSISNDNGKNKVQKLGMAPIAEPGLEYEYSILFELAMNHEAIAGKDRTGLFDGKMFLPSEETGKLIKDWLSTAKPDPRKEMMDKIKHFASIITKDFVPKQKEDWIKNYFKVERYSEISALPEQSLAQFLITLEKDAKEKEDFQD